VAILGAWLAVSGAACCETASRVEQPKNEVWIRLFGSARVGGLTLPDAEAVANKVLASAGVHVRWQDCDLPARSKSTTGADTIDIRFVYSTPSGRNPGALAESRPFAGSGVRVTVFFDRVAELSKHEPLFTPRILGHVLAHEIGHVLQGTDLHSPTGVMKARWDDHDYCAMRAKVLRFTPEDAVAIASHLSN